MGFMDKETLCWKCKRPGTGSCSWDKSRAKVPVEGWNAEKVAYREGNGTYSTTYHVNECPLFILDEDYVRRMNQSPRGPKPKIDRSAVENLIRFGWTDKAIALRFGIARTTVNSYRYRWRQRQKKMEEGR